MLPKSNLYSDLSDIQEELVEEKCEITSSEKERDEKNFDISDSGLFGPILPKFDLIFYFVTNVPSEISDDSFKVLFNSVYPNSTFSRLMKSRQCGFVGIPKSIVDVDIKLQAAQKSDDGIAFILPSGAAIFLRPKRKRVAAQKNKLAKKGSFSQATRIISDKPTIMNPNSENYSIERVAQLESKITELEKSNQELKLKQNVISQQLQLMGSNMDMKFTHMQNIIYSANKSMNNNLSALATQISNLTQLMAKNVEHGIVIPNQFLTNQTFASPLKKSISPIINN